MRGTQALTAPSRNDFSDSPVCPTINPRSPSGLSALERSAIIMNNKIGALLLFECVLLLSSCQKKTSDSEIEELFRSNFFHAQNEDLSEYMATIDPSAPMRDQTQRVVAQLFSDYDLSYNLESIEIISESATQATVRVTQTTKKVSGPDFKDHCVITNNELRKNGGKWRIFISNIEKIEYLTNQSEQDAAADP